MKKYIAFLMCILFIVSLSAGCSKKDNEPDRGQSVSKETSPINSDNELKKKVREIDAANDSEEEVDVLEEGEIEEASQEAVSDYKVNVLDSMTSAQKRELNLFLSNFSEAGYMREYLNEIDSKVWFAYIHDTINNNRANITARDGKNMISANGVDTILNRFFGSSISHGTPGDGSNWTYEGGYYSIPAADGDTYWYFTTAVNIAENGDGTCTADFNVYTTFDNFHDPIPSSCYSLTDEEASDLYVYSYSGSAVLRPKNYNGSDTYEVVSYKVYQ